MAKANETSPATASAHTPGPWFSTKLAPEFCSHNEMFRISSDADYPDVADVFFRNTDEEAEANARLIAAAPELLERCKMSLADADAALASPEEVADYNWKSIADDLRELIAKAE